MVCRYSPPIPPVASRTVSVRSSIVPSGVPTSTPATRPASVRTSSAGEWSHSDTESRRRAAATTVSSSSAPVRSPCAWTIRLRLWAPSNPSRRRPSSPRSNSAPCAESHAIASGAAAVMARTTSGSHRPAPAARVSSAWSAGSSSGPTAAAMPPCAQPVDVPVLTAPALSTTQGSGLSSIAAVSPASPAPMMTGQPASMTRVTSPPPRPASARRPAAPGRRRRRARRPRWSWSPARAGCCRGCSASCAGTGCRVG